jgi:hypothetical protein
MMLLMVIPPLVLLVCGVVLVVRPGWCLNLYVRWNALFGVDLNRLISSRSRMTWGMRIGGVACLLAAVIMLAGVVVVLRGLG